MVIRSTETAVERKSWPIACTGYIDAFLRAFDTQLLCADGGFTHDGFFKYRLRISTYWLWLHHCGRNDVEGVGRAHLYELAQIEQRQFVVILILNKCKFVLRHSVLGFVHLQSACFLRVVNSLNAFILNATERKLFFSHIDHFFLIECLQIGLSNLHTQILTHFLQVGRSSLEIEFCLLLLVGKTKTCKEWQRGTDAYACAGRVAAHIGVLCRQTAPETKALICAAAHFGQSSILGR